MKFSEKAFKSGAYRYVINEESNECAVVVDTLPEGEFLVPEKVTIKKKEYTVVGVMGKSSNAKITNCVLPSTIKYLIYNSSNYHGTFEGCKGLSEIKIPDGVESISCSCFSGCNSLVSADLGKGVNLIDFWAFRDCTALKTVITTATNINDEAFEGAPNVTFSNQTAVDDANAEKEQKRMQELLRVVSTYRFYFEYDYEGDEQDTLHEPGQCLWINENGEVHFAIATPDEVLDGEATGDVMTGEDFVDCNGNIDFAILLAKKFGISSISDVKLRMSENGELFTDSIVVLNKKLQYKSTIIL